MRRSALAHAHPSEASVHCGYGRTCRPHRRPALGPASVGRPATPARLASGPRVSCNEPGGGGLGRRVGQRACARCFVRCGPVSAAWARPRRPGSCRGPSPLVTQTRERAGYRRRPVSVQPSLAREPLGPGTLPCLRAPAPPRRPGACPTLSAVGCPAQLASRPRAAARASDSCASAATTAH